MPTIDTSTSANATRQPGQRKVVIAGDGTACAVYYDGSALVFRTAATPYSSWSLATTIDSSAAPEADIFINADDSIDVLYKNSGVTRLYHRLLTKSGSTWTVGSNNDVFGAASDFGGNGDTLQVLRDGADRAWAVYYRWTGSVEVWEARYSTDDGASWTSSLTNGAVDSGARFNRAAAITGDYLLVARADEDALKWQRLDTTGTLTAWSSEQSDTTGLSNLWTSCVFTLATESGGSVVAAWQDDGGARAGITTAVYDPDTDTWGSSSDISGDADDKCPAAIAQGGEVVVAWQKHAGTNDYAVVYKRRSGGSWGSRVELQASGANNVNISLGASATVLAALWTSGTGSPYDVVVAVEASAIPAAALPPPRRRQRNYGGLLPR